MHHRTGVSERHTPIAGFVDGSGNNLYIPSRTWEGFYTPVSVRLVRARNLEWVGQDRIYILLEKFAWEYSCKGKQALGEARPAYLF